MSKSILTVTTPKDCANCVLCHRLDLDRFVCQPKGKIVPITGKPDFCPLKPMPKRKDLFDDGSPLDSEFFGWNECIEAIEGSEEGE